jgi:hypothetical protein
MGCHAVLEISGLHLLYQRQNQSCYCWAAWKTRSPSPSISHTRAGAHLVVGRPSPQFLSRSLLVPFGEPNICQTSNLIACSLGMVGWLTWNPQKRMNGPRLIGFSLVILSFGYPLYIALPQALKELEDPAATYAHDLAKRLQAASVYGAIAGTGCYSNPWAGEPIEPSVALFTNQPYYDCESNPTTERLKRSAANLVIVYRRLPLIAGLDQDPAFKNLDSVLFPSKDEADTYPWKVYQIDGT